MSQTLNTFIQLCICKDCYYIMELASWGCCNSPKGMILSFLCSARSHSLVLNMFLALLEGFKATLQESLV